MRTRCPHCETVFRITPEQLRAKGGRVRCGHCQQLFNAFDHMQQDGGLTAALRQQIEATTPAASASLPQVPFPVETNPIEVAPPLADDRGPTEAPFATEPPVSAPASLDADPEPSITEETVELIAPPAADVLEEARQAGLVAARDIVESSAYNRWAAGTLAGSTSIGTQTEAALPRWPFLLGALLLLGLLLAQVFEHYPSEIALRFPAAREWYAALNMDVPLPRQSESVSIESSDLQADSHRGFLVLQATLRNKASFAQAWPALELTLTDTQDQLLSRRVLMPEDYLPTVSDGGFAAQSEVSLRLWLDGQQLPAAGYRLYVFYP